MPCSACFMSLCLSVGQSSVLDTAEIRLSLSLFNLLKPNDIYIRRAAALTSRRYILNIYSTNIRTEYSKRAA